MLISQKKAEKIAQDFLDQYHDTSTIEYAFLENEIWVITAKIGLVNQQVRKILIDAQSGRILSYTDKKLEMDDYGIKQAQVAFAVEKALLKIGAPAYEKVVQKLYEDYRCRLFDCFEYPEYLHNVIKEIFGDNYKAITDAVKVNLKDISGQKPVEDFLNVISK